MRDMNKSGFPWGIRSKRSVLPSVPGGAKRCSSLQHDDDDAQHRGYRPLALLDLVLRQPATNKCIRAS